MSCPYCKSKEIKTIWPKTDFWHCETCLLYFRNPMPTEKELTGLYQSSWSTPEYNRAETGGTDLRLAYVYAYNLARSLGKLNLSGLKIMDFGAGRGAMLQALQSLGARVCGVEPFGYEYLRSQGFKAYQDVSEVQGDLDGIVTIDVLEHLPAPWTTLERLRDKLKEGGWIYIATPNPLGANARIAGEKWREAKKAGHLIFLSPTTMERMLEDVGFRHFKRLKWFIRFHRFPRWILDYLLQATRMDGELRYLAWK